MTAQIIDFIGVKEHIAAADRCENAAPKHDPKTAETIRNFAQVLRVRAAWLAAGNKPDSRVTG